MTEFGTDGRTNTRKAEVRPHLHTLLVGSSWAAVPPPPPPHPTPPLLVLPSCLSGSLINPTGFLNQAFIRVRSPSPPLTLLVRSSTVIFTKSATLAYSDFTCKGAYSTAVKY